MVSLTDPSTARIANHQQHLLTRKISEHWLLESLHWHTECAFNDEQRRDVAMFCILQERPQCCQSGVAATHRVVPYLFQVIEKCQNQFRRNINQFCGIRRSTQVCLDKIQE